jgi:HEAT repeat protein
MPLWLLIFLVLMVLVPFLFWRSTWFGRPLTDKETGQYLTDAAKPRKAQHALVQIAERIARGDQSVKRWYPQVVALARHEKTEIRATVAWVMGQDNQSEEFHQALVDLVGDADPVVRQNAALSLVRFGDARGRVVLRQMLLPFSVTAPAAGTLETRLQEEAVVNAGTLLGRIQTESREEIEVRAPLPGSLRRWTARSGQSVHVGEDIAVLAPDENQVWEALRALYLVGEAEDLELIEPFARGAPRMPEKVQQQAELTLQAIRQRVEKEEKTQTGGGSG